MYWTRPKTPPRTHTSRPSSISVLPLTPPSAGKLTPPRSGNFNPASLPNAAVEAPSVVRTTPIQSRDLLFFMLFRGETITGAGANKPTHFLGQTPHSCEAIRFSTFQARALRWLVRDDRRGIFAELFDNLLT